MYLINDKKRAEDDFFLIHVHLNELIARACASVVLKNKLTSSPFLHRFSFSNLHLNIILNVVV